MNVEKCKEWIEAALEYSGGTHTIDDVEEAIRSGRMQLWPADRACAVTEIVVYPRKTVLHIFLGGGDMDQLFDMIDDAAAWGKRQGCTSMSLSGRMGWQRAMKPLGWEPKMVVMEKEL